ncbi:MAG: glycoside hydrolase family 25 protein [Clostridiales bacterium]|nr:glycoside hydrolase family 25 protein [Clostridiales bacterium]
MKHKRVFLILSAVILCLFIVGGSVLLLYANGLFVPTQSAASRYPVRGVDVSSYQGQIDWQEIAGQNISFAFVKATEGSSHTDSCFDKNWADARAAGFFTGAYHFFSYDSPGAAQANHFIRTVPAGEPMLPPVVDVEFYGDYEHHPAAADTVRAELVILLKELKAHYGQTPILYATGRAYRLYLTEGFEEYSVWIRDVFWEPSLPDGRDWLFWQYTGKGRLSGFDGDENLIDLNVFAGSKEELAALCK